MTAPRTAADERRLFALALAYHQTRQNNDAPEFDMGVAKERAERMLFALASKRKDRDLAMEPHGYVVIEAEAAAPLESALRALVEAWDALMDAYEGRDWTAADLAAEERIAAWTAARAALAALAAKGVEG